MTDKCKNIFIVKIIDVKGIFHLPEESHNKLEITGELVRLKGSIYLSQWEQHNYCRDSLLTA